MADQLSAERAFVQEMIAGRERLGWSQTELSRQLKRRFGVAVHQTTITRMERWADGRPNPQGIRFGMAVLIAGLLDISLDALVSPDARLRAELNHLQAAQDDLARATANVEAAEGRVRAMQSIAASEGGDRDA